MNIDIIDKNINEKIEKIANDILSLTIDEFFLMKQILIKKNPSFDNSNVKFASNSESNSNENSDFSPKKSESYEIVLEKIDDNPASKAQIIVALTKILKLPLMQAKNTLESLPCVLVKGIKNQEELETFRNQYFKNINVVLSLKKEN